MNGEKAVHGAKAVHGENNMPFFVKEPKSNQKSLLTENSD